MPSSREEESRVLTVQLKSCNGELHLSTDSGGKTTSHKCLCLLKIRSLLVIKSEKYSARSHINRLCLVDSVAIVALSTAL